MDVPFVGLDSESETDTYPLLMEHSENLPNSGGEHIINISISDASSSNSPHDRTHYSLDSLHHEERSSSGARNSTSQPSSTSARTPMSQPSMSTGGSNSRNVSTHVRRGDTRNRRRSPLNSGLWISIELALTMSQIVASVIVLSVSRHEHPRPPLFEWIVGYASGCVATLPLLYWRYHHRNQGSEPDAVQARSGSARVNVPGGPFSISFPRTAEGEDQRAAASTQRSAQNAGVLSARVKVLVEYLKMALDCFFAVWFVVGNVWIFGGHSSASDAPNLYRLCIVFLVISCIGYAMPFILCATICCCLPCILSVIGLREDLTQTRGATPESINALPTYKFKLKKTRSGHDRDNSSGAADGGVVAAGTDKERVISGEDAACCICLAKYVNNDELRELPCSHFLHKDCVDKWLKINASCPLCKSDVGETILGSISASTAAILGSTSIGTNDSQQQRGERRAGNGSGSGSANTTDVF